MMLAILGATDSNVPILSYIKSDDQRPMTLISQSGKPAAAATDAAPML